MSLSAKYITETIAKEKTQEFEEFTGISHRTPNLRIEMYNVYEDSGASAWKQVSKDFELEGDKVAFPVIRVGDNFKFNINVKETQLLLTLVT